MANDFAIQLTGIDLPGALTDEFDKIIFHEFQKGEIYHIEPPKGRLVAAGFDWTIIANIADVVGIASFLWLIYSELRKLNKGENKIGLFIAADPQFLYWLLGKTVDNKEEFIKDFTKKVKAYLKTKKGKKHIQQVISEIHSVEYWVRKNG